MSETDEFIQVGNLLPTLAHVESANGPFRLLVRWATGRRLGEEVIDVAPQIFAFKIYKPLRDNPALFVKASVSEGGTAIVWPENADLEISADALEEMAEDTMTCARFSQFLRDMKLTFDAAAAQLGISRRAVAYYAKEREVPRYISLACEALRERAAQQRSDRNVVSMYVDGQSRTKPRLIG